MYDPIWYKNYYEKNKARKIKQVRSSESKNPDRVRKQRQCPSNMAKQRLHNKRIKTKWCAAIVAIKTHYGCMNKKCHWKGKAFPSMLEFHHLANKDGGIQSFAKQWELAANEINKCIVLCACCHRLAHYEKAEVELVGICHVTDKLEPIIVHPNSTPLPQAVESCPN